MSSASAVNEISRTKKRYELQDRMLRGFAQLPNSTAKEICRHIGLQYEAYCDGPKRVWDLKKLGKIVVAGERECCVTKKKVEIYRIAEGARYCGGGKGLVSASMSAVIPAPSVDSGCSGVPESVVGDQVVNKDAAAAAEEQVAPTVKKPAEFMAEMEGLLDD